ncbi:hypothetical protein GO003_014445 [Methylicorpusculum oleiharenae]|uniref:hypothetical protein n=1 Tax=Methylicorpusculum oleiharenae TaxID=1338687 RepID=UPI001359C70F|nr:hypothetical protein [Methylicorpusculum oleiharenae]MCD2451591.1 hypothetical protein [Methylicorpusculum oleiharenae]
MKVFVNRHVYILIGLLPVFIYCLSYFLFETNLARSIQIKKMMLDAITQTAVSPNMLGNEYKARILWQSSSLLSIVAYLFAIFWSCSILHRCCSSGAQIKKIIALGLVIVTLTLLQLIHADQNSAMYNAIFSTTYEALHASSLFSQSFQNKVYIVINLINFLAALTPVFILVAVCSTISIAEEQNPSNLDFYIDRMNYLKQGTTAGSIILLFGIIHMASWMQWPETLLNETNLNKVFSAYISANSQFWGITFTLLLISLYVSAAAFLRARVQSALNSLPSHLERQKWLQDNGFTISFQKHILQLGMMLTPSIAGSLSSVFEIISVK